MSDLPSTVDGARSASRCHFVQFYETDAFLSDAVVEFLFEGLRDGEPALVIATEAHREAFARLLRAKGIDVAQAEAQHRLVMLDARGTLDLFMEDGLPHGGRFCEVLDAVLASLAPEPGARRIRAYGEMVDLLWRDGQPDAALQLEHLWNELATRHALSLLCAYGVESFHDRPGIPAICATHGRVLPPEPPSQHPARDAGARNVSSLIAEIARRMQTERRLRESLETQREAMDALRRAEADARESKEELRHFLDTATVPIHTVDRHGIITWANRAELDLLGYERDEYVGRPIACFHDDARLAEDMLRRLFAGETVHEQEFRMRAKDGSLRHVLISSRAHYVTEPGARPPGDRPFPGSARSSVTEPGARPPGDRPFPGSARSSVTEPGARPSGDRPFPGSARSNTRDGELHSIRCFSRDVTERKRTELERDRMIEELSRTVRLNETFASVLAHDLRNPLSTILMGGQILLGRIADPIGTRALQRTIRSVTRMQGMIDQLLDFSRARTGAGIPLDYQLAEVGVLAREVTEELRVAHPEVTIELDAAGDLRGELDANRLAQVFSNLVGNAYQHGVHGAPITLHLDGTPPDTITATIANRGTIGDELLPILFAPYRGVHQRGARSQGLGLGLFITDQIVRAHGGALTVRSQDGRTEFTLVLPRRAAGSAAMSFDLQPAAAPPELRERRPVGSATDESLRMLVKSIRDYAIFMLDPAGYVMSWNTGAQLIKGYSADEIAGRHFSIFYPREDVRSGKCERELAIAERAGQYEEQGWRLRKDGTPFWANVLITAVRDHGGALVGFAKVTRDLTEERLANASQRQQEERFRLLVDGVKEHAIFMLDPEGHVKTWNPGAARIKGYRADEIIGKHFSVFYPPEDIRAGKTETELEVATREGRFEEEGWRVRKDGSWFWANVVITALHDEGGELLGFAKVTRDLTERRQHEEDRIRLAHAQEAVRLRDEFLSIASHELRTPLTVLRMQIDTLRKRLGKTEPAIATQLDRTHRAGQRLTELVEMLLDVSCIATGTFELRTEPVDLAVLVRDVVDRMSESSCAARCTVACTLEENIRGAWDRSRVDQIVTNLLANAFKYAAGTAIEVSLHEARGTAVIEVRDHGPGLPPGREAILFGRFERAASMQHYGGLGLGLYVVDQIAQAHGGEASAANAPGGGACFRVKLPLRPHSHSRAMSA